MQVKKYYIYGVFQTCVKIPIKISYQEERFILAYSFKGGIPRAPGVTTYRRKSIQELSLTEIKDKIQV